MVDSWKKDPIKWMSNMGFKNPLTLLARVKCKAYGKGISDQLLIRQRCCVLGGQGR